jgi:hypothetical protein
VAGRVARAGEGLQRGGTDGLWLYRAAQDAGVEMMVIAPGKTPRGPSDRVKTDRKDAELLARLLPHGSPAAAHPSGLALTRGTAGGAGGRCRA